MSQIIIEQQFHYIATMTSKKYFPNTIYANRDAKLSPVTTGKARFSSIVNEAIRTIYLLFFIKIFCIKKHTSNFHLDIMARSIKNNFSFKYFYTLKKAYKQLSFIYYA